MVITYHGLFFVKIQHSNLTLAFNPPALKGVRPARFGADLVFISLNDERFNGTETLGRGERQPLVIDGPGEYEIKGVFVKGLQTIGPVQKINTVYLTILDGVRLAHLGGLTEPHSLLSQQEELGSIDVLFTPTDGLLNAKAAAKIAHDLEVKIVIPLGQEIKSFLKEMAAEKTDAVSSFVFKKKEAALKVGEVVVLKPV